MKWNNKEDTMMTDNKNMELNDEMMAKAAGGTADADPYGFLCEATDSREPCGLHDK